MGTTVKSPARRSKQGRPAAPRSTNHQPRATTKRTKASPAGRTALRSTLTARSQTTLPSGVRQALHLEPGDKLEYTIQGDQAVIRKATSDEESDPAVGAFLTFLATDIATHPEHLSGFPTALREEIERLTRGLTVDHDEPLDGAVIL